MQKRTVVEIVKYASTFIHVPVGPLHGGKRFSSGVASRRYYWCAGNDKGLPFWVNKGRGECTRKK